MSVSAGLGEVREVELAQGRVRYRDTAPLGGAQTVVFVHGVLVNGDLWRGVVPRLSERYRCVTPDLPLGSHDVPMRDDADLTPPGIARLLADLLAALDLDDVVIVANDSGGAFAQLLVTGHPQRVGRLVLAACDAFDHFPPPAVRPYVRALAGVPGAVWLSAQLLRTRAAQRVLCLPLGVTSALPPHDIAESWFAPSRRSSGVRRDLLKVIRGVDARYTLDAAERLRGFDRPTLLAWNSDDRLFPLAHAERLAALLPDARVRVIPGTRALVPEDQPDLLADAILSFLAATAGAPGRPEAFPARQGDGHVPPAAMDASRGGWPVADPGSAIRSQA